MRFIKIPYLLLVNTVGHRKIGRFLSAGGLTRPRSRMPPYPRKIQHPKSIVLCQTANDIKALAPRPEHHGLGTRIFKGNSSVSTTKGVVERWVHSFGINSFPFASLA